MTQSNSGFESANASFYNLYTAAFAELPAKATGDTDHIKGGFVHDCPDTVSYTHLI